jgi:hypothetical protein
MLTWVTVPPIPAQPLDYRFDPIRAVLHPPSAVQHYETVYGRKTGIGAVRQYRRQSLSLGEQADHEYRRCGRSKPAILPALLIG